MAIPPDHIESWIAEYLKPRYPEIEKPYREAFRLYEEAQRDGVLSQEALHALVAYAVDRRTVLSENVASMLGELADRFPEAQNALLTLARNRPVHARINALASLHSHKQSAVHEAILGGALDDPSMRVRALAADKIMGFGLRQLLPVLEAAIADSRNAEIKDRLEWERDLLRDGYRFRTKEDERVDVTVRRQGGGVASSLYSASEFKSKGVRQIVEELGGEWNG